MDKQQTLPEALQLSQEWYDETAKRIEETFGETTEKISDFMEIEANNIREEEFGEVDVNITKYERKLVLLRKNLHPVTSTHEATSRQLTIHLHIIFGSLNNSDLDPSKMLQVLC